MRSEGLAFSMVELARRAGVSPATPYNLFGTKSAILYALLNQSADRIFATTAIRVSDDPVVLMLQAADGLAQVMTSDATFYRPLYAYLLGIEDRVWRPAFMDRSRAYWLAAFDSLGDQPFGIPRETLGQLLLVQALGCAELWIHEDIANDEFARELRRASAAVLLGVAPDGASDLLRTQLLA